jgi:hypothetical protein
MTNFEFYKEKLQETGTVDFGVNKDTKKLARCSKMNCSNCLFHDDISDTKSCGQLELEFLLAEHKEQPKLTKKERLLCEILETGYIARDGAFYDYNIYYYPTRPKRKSDHWDDVDELYTDLELFERKIPNPFSFIKWEDEEPWKVEDLLKLEVIEE